MKARTLVPLFVVALAVFFASCASGPAAGGATSPENAATASLERAEALKKRAFDLKMFEVLPDDYTAASDTFAEGKTSYDAGEWDTAAASLDESSTQFESLISRGVGMLVSETREKAAKMKSEAMNSGASASAPTTLATGNTLYAAGQAAEGASDPEKALLAYERSLAVYEIAYKKSLATNLRSTILDNDWSEYDTGNFAIAEERYADSAEIGPESVADEALLASTLDSSDEAILRYNLVIQKAQQFLADSNKEKTDEAKVLSEEAKSPIAVKAQYEAAVRLYESAVSKYSTGDYEEAAKLFAEAEEAFLRAEQDALDKKKQAEEALRAAQEAADAATGK